MKGEGKGLGLALGGGGLLGVSHIGVLEVLEENGIRPALVTGTSAGSLVAALYAAGITPSEMREMALKLRREDLFAWNFTPGTFLLLLIQTLRDLVRLFQLLPRGLLSGARIACYVNEAAGRKTVAQLSFPLGLVATDLLTGNRVVFTNRPPARPVSGAVFLKDALLGLAVRASAAIPAVFDPVPYRGLLLADGGLVEMVPAALARLLGAKVVVAVSLGSREPVPEPESVVQVILRAINIMTRQGVQRDLTCADLVINPPAASVGLGDFDSIPELLEDGRKAALQALPDIKKYLNRR
ncbi:MAG: patatin-like phospholipase family protein [Bacillota bacterium]|nr:patatin-like phospholipase family protein [Bacillota bacterium]